jgi:hypothetical protein
MGKRLGMDGRGEGENVKESDGPASGPKEDLSHGFDLSSPLEARNEPLSLSGNFQHLLRHVN